jgi:hypothetical protein
MRYPCGECWTIPDYPQQQGCFLKDVVVGEPAAAETEKGNWVRCCALVEERPLVCTTRHAVFWAWAVRSWQGTPRLDVVPTQYILNIIQTTVSPRQNNGSSGLERELTNNQPLKMPKQKPLLRKRRALLSRKCKGHRHAQTPVRPSLSQRKEPSGNPVVDCWMPSRNQTKFR